MTPNQLLESPLEEEKAISVSSQHALKARVISSVDKFAMLQAPWDALMQTAGIRNLCMSHAWMMTWLRYFPPQQLLVIVVEDGDGRWVGAAPFMITRARTGLTHRMLRHVQFIGTSPTVYDWMSIACLPDVPEEGVLSAVADTLKKTRWDVLDLNFIASRRHAELLAAGLKPGAEAKALQETMPIPYIDLPETEADYEKMRRKKTRLEVNRHRNRFIKEFSDPLLLEFRQSSEATDAILTRFFAGHIQYWSERGSKSDFQRFPDLFLFYKDMLAHADTVEDQAQPRLLFSVLTLGEQQLSYHLGFWQGDAYLCHITNYNAGFRSYSPGTIHMDALVFDSLARGAKAFEFGRGDEPYKKMWTQTKRSLWNVRLFRNRLLSGLWQVDILLKKMLGKEVA